MGIQIPTFKGLDRIIANQDAEIYTREMGMDGHRGLRPPSSMARIKTPEECYMHFALREGVPLSGGEEDMKKRCKPCPGYSPSCEYYDPLTNIKPQYSANST